MNIIGIPAEYNPFHNGHALQIAKIRALFPDSVIIAAMSGHAVQRGSFAVSDKWQRGALAVQNGVDLVFELPYCFCGQTAERFAFGAVNLLGASGCDHLAFGTETNRFGSLQQIAEILAEEPQNYQEKLHAALQKGKSFAAARQAAITDLTDEKTAGLLKSPNNILAVEYLKAMRTEWTGGRFESTEKVLFDCNLASPRVPFRVERRGGSERSELTDQALSKESKLKAKLDLMTALCSGCLQPSQRFKKHENQSFQTNPSTVLRRFPSPFRGGKYEAICKFQHFFGSHMTPLPILREGADHDQSHLTPQYASAAAIRQALLSGEDLDAANVLPYDSGLLVRNHYSRAIEQYETLILSKLLTLEPEKLKIFPDIAEGLEFALLNAVKYHYQIDELVSAAASPRIPQSRIRRILMNSLLSFTKNDFEDLSKQQPAYLRVLAFNRRGQFWLKHLRKKSSLPILTNLHSNQTRLTAAGRRSLTFDCRSTDLFYLLRGEKEKIHADYKKHPIFTEELQ